MRGCCTRRAFALRHPRSNDGIVAPVRCFHSSFRTAEGEHQNPETRIPTAIRSRSATNAAKVWDQVSQLPSRSNATPKGNVTFEEAVKAAGGRPIDSSMSRVGPKEVVRRTYAGAGRPSASSRGSSRAIPASFSGKDPSERARSDLVRFRVRGGGEARGGATARGRGGRERGQGQGQGRGGPPSAPRPRQRRGAAGDGEEEDDREDDWETYTGYYQLFTSDDYVDNFATLEEAQSYARLQEFVDEYDDAFSLVGNSINDLAESKEFSKQELSEATEDALAEWDGDISEALEHLVEADEKAYPRHEPGDFSVDNIIGEVGGVPIGQGGTGNVVEDCLRYISYRESHLWRDPKELARKLVDGDFVKFRNLPEKREVLHLAEELGYKADTPEGGEHCGFEPPSQGARELLVQRLSRGQYRDPQDDRLRAEVLRNAARITGGNSSYPAASKYALLKTIQALMPPERTGEQPARQAQ